MLNCKHIVKIRWCEFLLAVNYLCNAIYEIAFEYDHDCKQVYKNYNLRDEDDHISKINHDNVINNTLLAVMRVLKHVIRISHVSFA